MMTGILVAIAAGAASVLMFASIISGTGIAVLLMYLAPLPLLVAALGWGPVTAAIGGVVASLTLGVMIGWTYMLAFALWAAIPALWLGHLLLLGRPAETPSAPANGDASAMEWYPIGHILLWIAAFAATITIGTLLMLGTDAETINATMRRSLSRMFGARTGASEIGAMMALIAPAAGALGTMVALTLNVWLAGKIVNMSGRLRRPWPDLKATTLPPMTMAALSAAIAFCFTGGLLALAAQVVSAAMMTAYAMVGFATLHTVTLAMKSRGLLLSFAYLTVVVFGWPIVLMTIVGLADAVFGFRQRFMRSHNPVVPS
ncbi:MAG: hypothetical protein A4S14_00770 [Proteobacteria bacterium SG_bin9]|nr:MAG: hypothetical protein A4S14_00770 [Proteobacteria bacterium SG_bin9]